MLPLLAKWSLSQVTARISRPGAGVASVASCPAGGGSDAQAQSVSDRAQRRGARRVGVAGPFVYVAVLAGDAGADGAAGRPGAAQRPDRRALELPPRGRLAVAQALLRVAPGRLGGPPAAGPAPHLSPLTCAPRGSRWP